MVVTGRAHRAAVQQQLPDLTEANIVLESEQKESLAAIGLAAGVVFGAVVLVNTNRHRDVAEARLRAASGAIAPQGWVYLEAPVHWTDEAVQACGLQAVKHMKAGAVHAHLLQRPFEG